MLTVQMYDKENSCFNIIDGTVPCGAVALVVSDSATLWIVAHQGPLSMGFSMQEYWSGLPFPFPGDHPNPGSNPYLLCLWQWQACSLPLEPSGKPQDGSVAIFK